MQNDELSKLGTRLRGNITTPGSDEYEAARKLYNVMIDCHGRVIIRCADVADVREAVLFARTTPAPARLRSTRRSIELSSNLAVGELHTRRNHLKRRTSR
jgi:hypothetical protein